MCIEWWYWICIGLFMLLSEALTPGGFYLLFIGVSAIVTGVLATFITPVWLEITIFTIMSIFSITVIRKPLVARVNTTTPKSNIPEFIGETATAINKMPAGKEGKVEVRGSIWSAKNDSDTDIAQNEQCTITARVGLLFIVKPK
jgi:membrane protein implicated in regulation of membrane protease activity